MSPRPAAKGLTRRAFIAESAFAGLAALAGCEKLLGMRRTSASCVR